MHSKLHIALLPKQSEFDRKVEHVANVLYGGARGGGKSHGIRLIMLKRRIQYSGSVGVIFRKTWEEVRDNHLNPLLEEFPALRDRYVAGEKEIKFENGSRLQFRHAKDLPSLQKKQGLEFHDLAIEEVGEWPEHWFEFLKASNRSSKPGIKPRCLLAGNPGGIGHKWLKRRFISRNFRGKERPEDYAFVPARVYDNPILMKNSPDYVNNLESITNEVLRRAWLDGDWDVLAGQYFDNVQRETHVVPQFEIPSHWQRFAMFDTGYNHPAAMLFVCCDEDGNFYVYREWVKSKKRTEEIAAEVMAFSDILKVNRNVPAGWDCWVQRGDGPSVAEKMLKASNNHLVLTKATIDRIPGAEQLRDYLAVRENGKPRLQFMDNCPITYDCITRMVHDTDNPEDVLKVDADDGDPYTGDDPYDALRMGMMSRPRITTPPPPPPKRDAYGDRYSKRRRQGGWTTA